MIRRLRLLLARLTDTHRPARVDTLTAYLDAKKAERKAGRW